MRMHPYDESSEQEERFSVVTCSSWKVKVSLFLLNGLFREKKGNLIGTKSCTCMMSCRNREGFKYFSLELQISVLLLRWVRDIRAEKMYEYWICAAYHRPDRCQNKQIYKYTNRRRKWKTKLSSASLVNKAFSEMILPSAGFNFSSGIELSVSVQISGFNPELRKIMKKSSFQSFFVTCC